MPKIKLSINNRWTGAIIFEWEKEDNTIADTIKEYIRQETEKNPFLRANLTRANLTRADLTRANLTDADLTRADLTDADLTRANLTRANLTDADLTRANLTDADLTDADLTDADLTDADLTRADLTRIKHDFFGRMLVLKEEVPQLREALIAGKINGSSYDGPCGCFMTTMATAKGCKYDALPELKPDPDSHTERWFLAIKEGDTPENSVIAKQTLEWIDEFTIILNR